MRNFLIVLIGLLAGILSCKNIIKNEVWEYIPSTISIQSGGDPINMKLVEGDLSIIISKEKIIMYSFFKGASNIYFKVDSLKEKDDVLGIEESKYTTTYFCKDTTAPIDLKTKFLVINNPNNNFVKIIFSSVGDTSKELQVFLVNSNNVIRRSSHYTPQKKVSSLVSSNMNNSKKITYKPSSILGKNKSIISIPANSIEIAFNESTISIKGEFQSQKFNDDLIINKTINNDQTLGVKDPENVTSYECSDNFDKNNRYFLSIYKNPNKPILILFKRINDVMSLDHSVAFLVDK